MNKDVFDNVSKVRIVPGSRESFAAAIKRVSVMVGPYKHQAVVMTGDRWIDFMKEDFAHYSFSLTTPHSVLQSGKLGETLSGVEYFTDAFMDPEKQFLDEASYLCYSNERFDLSFMDTRASKFATESSKFVFDFGFALKALEAGKRVTRACWHENGVFLFLVPGSIFKVNRAPLLGIYPEGTEINYCQHIDIKQADGKVGVWPVSQDDILAKDWGLVIAEQDKYPVGEIIVNGKEWVVTLEHDETLAYYHLVNLALKKQYSSDEEAPILSITYSSLDGKDQGIVSKGKKVKVSKLMRFSVIDTSNA